jgi:hypothetical protein
MTSDAMCTALADDIDAIAVGELTPARPPPRVFRRAPRARLEGRAASG